MQDIITYQVADEQGLSGYRLATISLARSESAAINQEIAISITSGIMNKKDIAAALNAISTQLHKEAMTEGRDTSNLDKFFERKKRLMQYR